TPPQSRGENQRSGSQGAPDGSPSPHTKGSSYGVTGGTSLTGRMLDGTLPEPDYRIQQSGRVVVRIKVDREGTVIEAKAQQSGSTVMDATLYEAAERAALKAKFNSSPDSPVSQWGTITYVFRLGQ
ncbi:MAG: energy transducer TonB, partial [Prevotellaceae bacterium]|nr:energy transducer TonB [Prevotellaceae bacterium]